MQFEQLSVHFLLTITCLNYSQMDKCGAACEAVAIHRDLAAIKQIHLPSAW
jgi:hypothetical protein